jgi:hypothetical protein
MWAIDMELSPIQNKIKDKFLLRLPNVQIWSILYRYEGLSTANR